MVQATREIRRALLQAIDAPIGTVTIIRRAQGVSGEEIVVQMAPGLRLTRERMPERFQGVPVRYEVRRQAKAFG